MFPNDSYNSTDWFTINETLHFADNSASNNSEYKQLAQTLLPDWLFHEEAAYWLWRRHLCYRYYLYDLESSRFDDEDDDDDDDDDDDNNNNNNRGKSPSVMT